LSRIQRRLLGLLGLLVAIALVVVALQLAKPVEPTGPLPNAGIVLRRLDTVPAAVYKITETDLARFPLLARVLRAYDNPACCPEATLIDSGISAGTLSFRAAEEEAHSITEYLSQQFAAANPSAASGTLFIEYQARYFEWYTWVT